MRRLTEPEKNAANVCRNGDRLDGGVIELLEGKGFLVITVTVVYGTVITRVITLIVIFVVAFAL